MNVVVFLCLEFKPASVPCLVTILPVYLWWCVANALPMYPVPLPSFNASKVGLCD